MKLNRLSVSLPQFIIFLFLIILFCYFRLRPIYFQTVPYTFDQGRDFLKAAEIVNDRNLTFIGPTTGINGVYHGVWWYYFLTIPYLIFAGWPEGFYYAVFFIHLVSVVAFAIFLINEFSWLNTLLFLSVVAISPYFIKIATFPISSTLGPPLMLAFLFFLYQVVNRGRPRDFFFLGLSLALLGETELPIALYFFPTFFLLWLLIPFFRKKIFNKIRLLNISIGFIIPVLPRLLFELKNNFIQTRALINFINNPSSTHPQNLTGAIYDRFHILTKFYFQIFYWESTKIGLIFFILALIIAVISYKQFTSNQKNLILLLTLSLPIIYLLMIVNRNNFFWDNYFEGIQFFYLFFLLLLLQNAASNRFLKTLKLFLVAGYLTLTIFNFYTFVSDKKPPPAIGLRGDLQLVDYLYQQNKGNKFCLRIYTPPVIPHTYNYLFNYYSFSKKYPLPSTDYINNQCWYIFDDEYYQHRVIQWRKQNIPTDAKLFTTKLFYNKTQIELWQINEKTNP